MRRWRCHHISKHYIPDANRTYPLPCETIDQAIIMTQALIARSLDQTYKRQSKLSNCLQKGTQIRALFWHKYCKQIKLAFSRWSTRLSYSEKLRLADQVQVVFEERRELEDKVREVQDANDGKERMLEMLSSQSLH